MWYLVRKETAVGATVQQFSTQDHAAAVRKLRQMAGYNVKLQGGKIFQFSDLSQQGFRYTILETGDRNWA